MDVKGRPAKLFALFPFHDSGPIEPGMGSNTLRAWKPGE